MNPPGRKSFLRIPVAIAAGQKTQYDIAADLYEPADNRSGAIQVLLNGGLFNRAHWDFPYKPELYSYVRYMMDRGWPCLAMDRIGNGDSARPPSGEVNCRSSAHTVHQIVQGLRSGAIGGKAYERIILVGHSTGSAVSAIEANAYQDVDGLVLTGWGHGIPAAMKEFDGWSWHCPAREDPKYAHLNLDDGYITIRPGAFGPAFYNVAFTDPGVLELEEKLKDTYCVNEGATVHLSLDTMNVRGSVLIANGMLDPYPFAKDRAIGANSATFAAFELPFWHPDVDLQTLVFPRHSHVLNTTAGHLFFSYVASWADAFVGREAPALRSKPTEVDPFGLKDVPPNAR